MPYSDETTPPCAVLPQWSRPSHHAKHSNRRTRGAIIAEANPTSYVPPEALLFLELRGQTKRSAMPPTEPRRTTPDRGKIRAWNDGDQERRKEEDLNRKTTPE